MRYVSGVTPPVAYVTGDQLKPVTGTRPVRLVAARSNRSGVASQRHAHEHNPLAKVVQGEAERRTHTAEERRLAARRLLHQTVLLELRSGIERRHRNLRDGDIVEHIDVEA